MAEQTTSTAPWWTVPDDVVAAAVLDAQMRIIDAAVRSARSNGWCESFESVMNQAFPDGPPDGSGHYVDSDGVTCRRIDRRGHSVGSAPGYDPWGFDSDGYDRAGRDRDGYDRAGYDTLGFNRDGLNVDGLHRDSDEYRARFQYDSRGYDRDGYDRRGYDRDGYDRASVEAQGGVFRFDRDGYDAAGYNRYGADRNNRDRTGQYLY